MSQAGRIEPSQGAGDAGEAILQAKYLDYCSARIAEVLLGLTADEMYVLAEQAARDSGTPDTKNLSYDRIVRLATQRMSQDLALPPFETWKVAYLEDPSVFEREMLGLWQDSLLPVAGRCAGRERESSTE